MNTPTPQQPVRVLIQFGRFTAGRFTAGPFEGQRAISNDGGRVFLPAGRGPADETMAGVFGDIWGGIFGSTAKGGAA